MERTKPWQKRLAVPTVDDEQTAVRRSSRRSSFRSTSTVCTSSHVALCWLCALLAGSVAASASGVHTMSRHHAQAAAVAASRATASQTAAPSPAPMSAQPTPRGAATRSPSTSPLDTPPPLPPPPPASPPPPRPQPPASPPPRAAAKPAVATAASPASPPQDRQITHVSSAPRAPPQAPPSPSPTDTSMVPDTVAARLNRRFNDWAPSGGLEEAGVLIHQVDGYESPDKAWLPCANEHECGNGFGDRWSASIVNAALHGPLFAECHVGIVLAPPPAAADVWCSYAHDGTTRHKTCGGAMPPDCYPGCHVGGEPHWCERAGRPGGCSWRAGQLDLMLAEHLANYKPTASRQTKPTSLYNEVVLDIQSLVGALPGSIEAFVFATRCRGSHRNDRNEQYDVRLAAARAVQAAFVAEYPTVHVPVLEMDLTADMPFTSRPTPAWPPPPLPPPPPASPPPPFAMQQPSSPSVAMVSTMPTPPPPPSPPAAQLWPAAIFSQGNGGFCTEHHCGRTCCPQPCRLAPGARAHVVFLHVEKTGGSSIECATQAWQGQGFWTNMGHTSLAAVTTCEARCGDVPTARVLTVREPYEYWQSVYKYAWLEGGPSIVRAWIAKHTYQKSTAQRRRGILSTLRSFLEWVEAKGENAVGDGISQSARVHHACGGDATCRYDVLLRTDNLSAGWSALIERYALPRVALPRLNAAEARPGKREPEVTLTEEAMASIERLDAAIFREFGYTRRSNAGL